MKDVNLLECVHCGDVLRKVGHVGLISYAWGDAAAGKQESLAVTLWLRKPVLVRVAADRTTLFTLLPQADVVLPATPSPSPPAPAWN